MLKYILIFLINITCLANIAKISHFKGTVFVDGVEISRPQKLQAGQEIHAKGPKSIFIVVYEDGSRFTVKNGRIKIESLENTRTDIRLKSGTIYTYIRKKIGRDKSSFKVHTKTASFGVRGTKFYVTQEENKSYLCVCKGSVEATQDGKSITLNTLEEIWTKPLKALSKKEASVEHVKKAIKWFDYLGAPLENLPKKYLQ